MNNFTNESCSICDRRNTTINAETWCLLCEEFLCRVCREHHSLSRYTEGHRTIPVLEYKELSTFIKDTTQTCSEHGRKYEFLCNIDDKLCCTQCVTSTHKKCTDFICLDDLISSCNFNNLDHDIQRNLECQSQNLTCARKDREGNRKLVKEQNEKYRNDMKSVRQKINEYFDQLENKLSEELDYTTDLQVKTLSEIVDDIQALQMAVDQMKRTAKDFNELPNDLLKFCGLRKLRTDVCTMESEVKSLIESEKMDRINVEMSISSDVSTFLRKNKSLGTIRVISRMRTISLMDKKHTKNLCAAVSVAQRGDIRLELSKQIQVPEGKAGITITGCTVTSTGTIYLADFSPSKRILTIKVDGTFGRDFTFTDYPVYDLALIDETHIALTTGSYRVIKIIDITTQCTLNTIKTPGNVYGVTFENGSLVYCVGKEQIIRLNLSDQSTAEVESGKLKNNSYICYGNEKYYHTGANGESIVCRGLNGDVIWAFESEKLRSPRSLAAHKSGAVFVVGESSNNLLLINKDGQTFTELLTNADGLKKPVALACNSETNTLVVCNKDGSLMTYKLL